MCKEEKVEIIFHMGRCIQHHGYMLGRYKICSKPLRDHMQSKHLQLTIMITKVPKLIKKSQAMRNHVLSTNHPSTNNENMFNNENIVGVISFVGFYFKLIGPQKKCGCTCPFFIHCWKNMQNQFACGFVAMGRKIPS
jgi:hypothetical protein